MVRIMIKHKFDKAHNPNWSSGKYKIIRNDNNNSLLDKPTKRNVFLKHDIKQ